MFHLFIFILSDYYLLLDIVIPTPMLYSYDNQPMKMTEIV